MIGKKINQLATELAPVSTDLTIIGDPISGVSKKITLAQLGAIFSGAVSFYTNLAGFPATGDINVIYCAKDTQKLYLWSGSAYVEVFPSQDLLDTYQLRSEKGNANGYASLDGQGKVPISQLPSSIMEYKGTWNASTNTPTLANGTGDTGDVYICNVAGTVNFGAGPITFAVGDYVIYSGTIWQRSSGAVGTVTSVAASITGDSVTISGSPVTTSGTLAFAFAGTGAQYIKGDGTLATFPNTIDQAKNLITEVYNSTGATLTKGTVVYINGGQGNLPTVTKALASGDSTSAQTYGIVQADITNMNNGFVVVAGRLTDIDTQAFTNGTQLYLSSTTAGAYTSTKQYAPAHLVYIGIIVRSHPTQGVIEVKIQNGYELDELHNVAAQTPTNNDGLFWEASTSLWKNKSIATILGYTPQAQLNGTGFVKASGTTITYDNSTYLTTSAAATTYLPLVLSSTTNFVDINGQQFSIYGSAGGYTSGRIIVDPVFSAIGYQNAGVFDGLKILTNGNAEFSNSGVTRFFNQVRFDSTLTNGTYTYTLPGATGTLALTTDIPSLTGYVPYTGATTNLNLGSNNLTAAAITGTSARITTLAGSVFADVNGNLGTTSGTQDTLTYWASQYSIASLSTSTYPSLTELSYVKGVTSSIQTQLNAKQNTLTNPVTGTGTTNYLPKFTGTSTIGNSQIFDNGTNVGIGTASPVSKLQVAGGGLFTGGDYTDASLVNAMKIGYNTANNYGYLESVQVDATERPLRVNQYGGTTSFGGKVSIGSNTPTAFGTQRFLVVGSAAAQIARFTDGTNGDLVFDFPSATISRITAQYGTGGVLVFANGTGFNEQMRLNASGNLSIGNTNDTYKLDVTGTGRFTKELYLNSASGSTGAQGFLFFNSGPNSASRNWRISNDQNAWGDFVIQSSSTQTGGITNTPFSIASTGAATFSSSVTATTAIFNGFAINQNPISAGTGATFTRYLNSGNDVYIGIENSASSFFGASAYASVFYMGSTNLEMFWSGAKRVTITNSGAATFSSSVTATSGILKNSSASPTYLSLDGTNRPSGRNYEIGTGYAGVGNDRFYIYDNTAGASRLVIDASGLVGIGTTSPNGNAATTNLLHINGSTSNAEIHLTNSSTGSTATDGLTILQYGTQSVLFNLENDAMLFGTNNAERMRITSGGNVGIGTSSPLSGYRITTVGTGGSIAALASGSGDANFYSSSTTIGYHFYGESSSAKFYVVNGGQIYSTSTSISAISDVRHKENIRTIETGLNEILLLKPSRFDWKEGKGTGKKDVAGFIAQDIEKILPDLVDEWKETMGATESFKSIRMTDLIPTLVKAIQELKQELDTIKNK